MSNPDQPEYDLESTHPGWQNLASLFGIPSQPFDITFLLRGYEFSSNAYVMNGSSLAMVDPGNDYTAFMDLARLGIQPGETRKIVLTHGHHDHAMGMFELLRSYPRQAKGFELLLHEAGPRQFKEVADEFGCTLTLLKGGETIELAGVKWEVIHTPGHTVDGICLYHAPSKTAITGDTVLPHAMAAPDKFAGGRLDYYLLSVKDLLRRDIENLFPGHGPVVASVGRQVIEQTYESLMMKTIGVEKTTPWIDGAVQLAEKGMLEDAVFCCDKQLAVSPGHWKTLQLKCVCLNDLGRFQEALDTIEQMTRLGAQAEGSAAFTRVAKGYSLMGLGSYDESVTFFDEALRLDPKARDVRMYKGMALYLGGKYDEAMEIPDFQAEFVGRFKEELLNRRS